MKRNILILLAVVFALKAPAADLNAMGDDIKDQYVDSSGLPYFSEMDSYYNLRLTQNFADSGHLGDEVINGSDWDMHRYAPDGNAINYESMIVYVTSWIHDFVNNFFGGEITVAGLVTATDIKEQLSQKPLGEELIISSVRPSFL